MASYAEMAARGPKQTPEEAYVFPILITLSLSRWYWLKQRTKHYISAAPQLAEIEPSESTSSLVDVDSGVSVVSSDFKEQDIQTETQEKRHDLEEAVAEEEEIAREKAQSAKKKVKEVGRKAERKAEDYAQNPVYATNAVLSTILAIAVGVNAYNKYKVGQLSWRLVGIYTGTIAAYGALDFYATRFFNQKYEESKK